MITTQALSHTYKSTLALDNATITLRKGTISGIIGPNGSGKSTLMRILSGHMFPTSGKVFFEGKEMTPDDLLGVCSYVGDGSELVAMRVPSILNFARCRPTWNEDLFQHLIGRFGMPQKKNLARVSTGQKSMFAACISLASQAPMIFLDEVQAHMDVPSRYALYEEIIELASSSNSAVILSTHLISELENLIEDLIVLSSGKVIAQTTADDLRSRMTALVGPTREIDQAIPHLDGVKVASQRSLGATQEVVLDGSLTPEQISSLAAVGISLSAVPFQDAFLQLIGEEK
ncbi:MAG: ABC transporter ATP-binding protein [Actinomycetaceae bacterium]|nr:ABC transporter ATP-binding protein [Actinomycetaceae bacterium]